jgi:hypothetical protein
MNIFTGADSDKFLGGIVYYGFEDRHKKKLTVAFALPEHRRPAPMDMDNAVACEILDNGEFHDIEVTINPDSVKNMVVVKADGTIRLSWMDSDVENLEEALQYLVNRLFENLGEKPTAEEAEAFREREIGIHVGHCCALHGCKYGDGKYCVVENKTRKQDHPCEQCVDIDEAEAEVKSLQEEIEFVRSLKGN